MRIISYKRSNNNEESSESYNILQINQTNHQILAFSLGTTNRYKKIAKMSSQTSDTPIYAPFFGVMGVASAIIFSSLGAAYGTAKSGSGIAAMAVMRPELVNQSIIPVVMAGIVAIYGLVVAAVISNGLTPPYRLFSGFLHLGAGLSVGLAGLAAGFAIGVVGDAGVRGIAQQPRLFVGMILILIFAEVLGLYGFIVALILSAKANPN